MRLFIHLSPLRTLPPPPNYNVLLDSQRQHGPASIDIVLVRPRNPLNIGAAARAMANFGFPHLTVVDPFERQWRDARSAVDSEQILLDARCTDTVAEAIAPATLFLGTGSLTYRKPEQPVIQLPSLAPLVQNEIATGGRVAILFGPENHGLSRDDLSWCHRLIEIPTSSLQPSMNLGQAVAVTLYELTARAFPPCPTYSPSPALDLPSAEAEGATSSLQKSKNSSSDLELLAGLIEETMLAARYSPVAMQAANRHDLRLSLRRMAFARHDLRRALGLFRRILHSLNS